MPHAARRHAGNDGPGNLAGARGGVVHRRADPHPDIHPRPPLPPPPPRLHQLVLVRTTASPHASRDFARTRLPSGWPRLFGLHHRYLYGNLHHKAVDLSWEVRRDHHRARGDTTTCRIRSTIRACVSDSAPGQVVWTSSWNEFVEPASGTQGWSLRRADGRVLFFAEHHAESGYTEFWSRNIDGGVARPRLPGTLESGGTFRYEYVARGGERHLFTTPEDAGLTGYPYYFINSRVGLLVARMSRGGRAVLYQRENAIRGQVGRIVDPYGTTLQLGYDMNGLPGTPHWSGRWSKMSPSSRGAPRSLSCPTNTPTACFPASIIRRTTDRSRRQATETAASASSPAIGSSTSTTPTALVACCRSATSRGGWRSATPLRSPDRCPDRSAGRSRRRGGSSAP